MLLFPLHAGASTLLVEKATPVELADLIDEHRRHDLLHRTDGLQGDARGGDADRSPSLTKAVSAGEHLAEATWQAFRDATGVEIIDGIGATEMLHIFISAAETTSGPGRPGGRARATPRRSLDARRQPSCRPGQPGRLAVKGPTGCRYLDDPRQAAYVHDGWNITGDTFSRDDDGYFWYQARSDDMIISSGYNIAAPEVEEALLKHPEVARVRRGRRPRRGAGRTWSRRTS